MEIRRLNRTPRRIDEKTIPLARWRNQFGAVSAILVAPCVAPPVLRVLAPLAARAPSPVGGGPPLLAATAGAHKSGPASCFSEPPHPAAAGGGGGGGGGGGASPPLSLSRRSALPPSSDQTPMKPAA